MSETGPGGKRSLTPERLEVRLSSGVKKVTVGVLLLLLLPVKLAARDGGGL